MGNIKNAFLTPDEQSYSKDLESSKVSLPTPNRIGAQKLRAIYADATQRLQDLNPNLAKFEIWNYRLKFEELLSIKENDPNKLKFLQDKDVKTKNILAESIINLAETGLFTDTDMIYIENYLNLLLSSNVDEQENEIIS